MNFRPGAGSLLELTGVSKVYPGAGSEVRALDEVSLAVGAGEFVAVRGPSGCGKSTLLGLVGGLAKPTAGTVVVAGETVSALGPAERARFRAARIGFVFQLFHLLPYLSVLDNVLVAAPGDASAAGRARELLSRFGLESRLGHRPGQLSAGERQRVAMARALLNGPQLLLADEPTGNLDPESREALLEIVCEFHAGGGTVLLVTHDEAAAARAGRTLTLRRGRIVEPGAKLEA